MRAAADAGYTPAKVYLANLYELGIHYKADREKADVWYRNAARSSGVKDEPGTPEYARAMAEIGAVRYCLEIAEDTATSEEDRSYFLKKAKAFGYRDPSGPEGRQSPIPPSALEPHHGGRSLIASDAGAEPNKTAPQEKPALANAAAEPHATNTPKEPQEKAKENEKKPAPKPSVPLDWSLGAYCILYAVVFMAGALAGGHALHEGAKVLVAIGKDVPLVHERVELIRPIAFGVIGVLPTLIVYRLDTLVRALVVGGFAGVIGEVCWTTGKHLVPERMPQILGFAAAGFLASLLVLGIFGGTRSSKRPRIKRR
jgi:hypothetical protein